MLLGFFLVVAAASPTSSPAPSSPPGIFDKLFSSTAEPQDNSIEARARRDDLKLVTVTAGRFTLSESLALYPVDQGWCAPVDPFLDALGLDHRRTSDALQVTLYEPRRVHEIKLGRLERSPEGECLRIDDAAKLAETEISYNPVELTLALKGDIPVPSAARREREESKALRMIGAVEKASAFPRIDNPYHWVGIPTVDVAMTAGFAGGHVTASAIAEGSGDLLKATANWRVGIDLAGKVRLAGKLERIDPDGNMLGPLHARRVVIGDTTTPAQPLIAAAQQSRGIIVSTAPEWRADLFDRLVINGPLEPGWTAELSVDGRLLGTVEKPNADGGYRFEDIALKVGANRFVIDLYGPHGEHDRRVVERNVGSEQYPENETSVVFGVAMPIVGHDTMAAGVPVAPPFVFATAHRGLSNWASIRMDGRAALAGNDRAIGIGVDASVLGGVAGLSLADRSPGGLAGSMVFGRRFGTFNLLARYVDYGRSPSPWAGPEEVASRRVVSAEIGGTLAIGSQKLSVALGAQHAIDRAGTSHSAIKSQVSLRRGNLRLDNQLLLDWRDALTMPGTLSADIGLGRFHIRGQAAYMLAPKAQLVQLAVSGDIKAGAWALRGTLGYDVAKGGKQIGAGFSRRFGNFELSVDGGWGRDGPQIGAGVRFAVGRVPGRGIKTLPAGSSRTAILAPHLVDPLGAPVADGRYLVANSLRQETSGKDGLALIGGVASGKPAAVELQLSSLSDDRLRADRTGVEVVGRPGQILPIDFRLHTTGSIEVRLVRRSGDRDDPLSGISVTLEGSGRQMKAMTDFDGYALFEGIPLGAYKATSTFDATSANGSASISIAHPDTSIALIM